MSVLRAAAQVQEGSALVGLARFDGLDADDAAELLRPCCASRRWIRQVVSGRPYGTMRRLVESSNDVVCDLGWPDLAEALAAYRRFGERGGGTDRGSAWSWQEQSGAGDPASAPPLAEAVLAYERRFGHAFLICAAGRSAAEIRAAVQQRLTNPTRLEREIVRAELRAVVRLRLIKTFH